MMSTKFLIIVLGIFLFVQCSYSNAIGKATDSSEEEDEALLKFRATIKTELTTLMGVAVNLSNNNFNIIEEVAKANELFEKSSNEEDGQIINGEAIAKEFVKQFNKFLLIKIEEPGPNASVFERSLTNAKKTDQEEYKKKFTSLTDHIVAATEEYWNSLSAAWKLEEKGGYDTYMKLKNETNLEKKLEIFKNLIVDSSEEN